MELRKTLLISFAVSLLVWMMVSWPLPKLLFKGIPASAHDTEVNVVRTMVPGDHLQLMYNYWLFQDMMVFKTPWLNNLYEFNTGDDEETVVKKAYYFPFSFFYAIGQWIGGRAFGWNLSTFLSIWLTYLFTWLLVRRYGLSDLSAWFAALVALLLPFRWIILFGGSPTGFALLWIPVLWYGLDIAVRDDRKMGGVWAGLALLFAIFCDVQLFFFGALSTPLWMLMALVHREGFVITDKQAYLKMIKALLTAVPFLILTFLYALVKKARLENTHILKKDWSWAELGLFSPNWTGLFSWHSSGVSSHIFMGVTILIVTLLAIGILVWSNGNKLEKTWKECIVILVVLAAVVGVILLALGTNGPFGGKPFQAARKLIPIYDNMRQSVKIFCLMPTLMAVLAALSFAVWQSTFRDGRRFWIFLCVIGALCLFESRSQLRAMICVLDPEQKAYASVVLDAEEDKQDPHVLVVPLWPGNSSWSSLYQYYVSLYRIRMVNGYHPAMVEDYVQNIFRRFESVNKGHLADDQIDELLERGVGHVILHENAFPEKVSPFAVSFTLQNLLNHPRLKLLERSDGIWAFKLLEEPRTGIWAGKWTHHFPARRWQAEHAEAKEGEKIDDPTASHGTFVRLTSPTQFVEPRYTRAVHTADLRYMIRVKGVGTLKGSVLTNEATLVETELRSSSNAWNWITLPVPSFGGHVKLTPRLVWGSGEVDVDMIILAAGEWRTDLMQPLVLPAACFFHAGHIDLSKNSVVLNRDRIGGAIAFYGPKLPLERGTYDLKIDYSSTGGPGMAIGAGKVVNGNKQETAWNDLISGTNTVIRFVQEQNLPFSLQVRFDWVQDLELNEITIIKVPDGE